MPRPSKKAVEPAREPTSEPIRVPTKLVDIIRLVAAAKGMSVPKWIELNLTPIALEQLNEVPSRVNELKRPG